MGRLATHRVFVGERHASRAAKQRAAFMAAVAARRLAAFSRVRVSARRPLGVIATRGFRPLGRRSRVEKKVIDVSGTYQVNTTGTFTLLNGCIPGSDYTNRIGRKIQLKSVYVRGRCQTEFATTPAAGSAPGQQLRMILLMDYQPNGAAPATTDVLFAATPQSQLQLSNRDRFKIIRDDVFTLDPFLLSQTATQSYASACNQVKEVNTFAKLNEETVFNAGTAGTIADINSGALYMFWIGSEAAGTGNDGNAIVSARVRFTDN